MPSKDILEDRENNGTIIPGLNTRISNGEKILKSIEAIKTKKETFDKNNETLQRHSIMRLMVLMPVLKTKERRNQKSLRTVRIFPDRWGFEDDYLTYDGILSCQQRSVHHSLCVPSQTLWFPLTKVQ